MIEKSMYRAHIVESPEFEDYLAFDHHNEETDVLWRRPVGWKPSPWFVDRYETDKFFEPKTDRWYMSRSSAARRVSLLNQMGYKAIVQRSAPVVWPPDGRERVNDSGFAQVAEAIRVLKRNGVIGSADDLIK